MMEAAMIDKYYAARTTNGARPSVWRFVMTEHGLSQDLDQHHPMRKTIEDQSRELAAEVSKRELAPVVREIVNAILIKGYGSDLIEIDYLDQGAEIQVRNPFYTDEVIDRREGDRKWHIGVRGGLVGKIHLYANYRDHVIKGFGYNFIDTPYRTSRRTQRLRSGTGLRETGKLSILLTKIKAELSLNSEDRVAKDRAATLTSLAHENKRHARWDHQRLLQSLLERNADRAFEILAESNVVLPDDFKAAMSDFLDLKVILKGMEE